MVNENGLYRYLKDMENCQITLYKKNNELEKRIENLENMIGDKMSKNNSRLVQSCYIKETLDNRGLDQKQALKIGSLYRVLAVLVDEGFENYDVRFGYDSNCAFTGAWNDFDIRNGCIFFKE